MKEKLNQGRASFTETMFYSEITKVNKIKVASLKTFLQSIIEMKKHKIKLFN